jgi:hypothetical protein
MPCRPLITANEDVFLEFGHDKNCTGFLDWRARLGEWSSV